MTTPRLATYRTYDGNELADLRAHANGRVTMVVVPVLGPYGDCLDEVRVPAATEFVVRMQQTALHTSPYEPILWMDEYDDGHLEFTLIDPEDTNIYRDRKDETLARQKEQPSH